MLAPAAAAAPRAAPRARRRRRAGRASSRRTPRCAPGRAGAASPSPRGRPRRRSRRVGRGRRRCPRPSSRHPPCSDRPAARSPSSARPARRSGRAPSGPHQHVAEDRPGEAHRDHVADLPAGAEPLGFGSGPNTGIHIRQPKKRKAVLERVDRRRPVGVLVERGDVPDEEVDRPERQGDARDGRGPGGGRRSRIARIGCSSGPVRPRTSSSVAMSPISRCSAMWAITSSSAMMADRPKRATTITSRPEAKHAWRQTRHRPARRRGSAPVRKRRRRREEPAPAAQRRRRRGRAA